MYILTRSWLAGLFVKEAIEQDASAMLRKRHSMRSKSRKGLALEPS